MVCIYQIARTNKIEKYWIKNTTHIRVPARCEPQTTWLPPTKLHGHPLPPQNSSDFSRTMSFSRMFRFLSNPSLLLSLPSPSSLRHCTHSHSLPQSVHIHNDADSADGVVSSFHRMLHMDPTPPIIQFVKILALLLR